MEVVAGAMTPLLRKLGELLAGELTLEKRVREDVVYLERELTAMHAALCSVAEVPPDRLDDGVAHWAREVRELSYDMEDAVDAFTVRIIEPPELASAGGLKSRVHEFIHKTARLFGKSKALHQIAGALAETKALAEQLAERRRRYGRLELQQDGGRVAAASTIDPRLTAMFGEVSELVGVDGARDELIQLLLSDHSNKKDLRTVAIVGFGGLGKTTVARAVYDWIKVRFDCGAFVSVSRSPDITRVLKKMLYELDDKEFADINEAVRDAEQLIGALRRFLDKKRFLLIVDDIWDEKTWEIIKYAFPRNHLGSRIIMTTRIFSVSEACCSSTHDKIYRLKRLSDSDSKRLFYTRIFQRCADGCPPDLEQVSQDILKKCGGVPLAIISIASLLAGHMQIKPKDQWHVVLNSIGRGLTEGGSMEDMQTILSFSYYDLPPHLKTCLLYLSVFPEDYEIEKSRLIWRWIAEGFIQDIEKGDNNLFELGESYFTELINRSMIEPVAIDFEGRAHACRVHDMVLDLIRSLSRKENFVTIWEWDDNGGHDHNNTTSSSQSMVVRRLSLQNNATAPPRTTPTSSLSHVRSFSAFNPAINSIPSLSQFRVVRVMDLQNCDLKKCNNDTLRHVGSLCHLRYLGLRRTRLAELPEEIGKLKFLLTLDVRGFRGALPASVVRLKQLMCLRLDWKTRLPKAAEQQWSLAALEELTGLTVDRDSAAVVSELGRLPRLRLLKLRWESLNMAGARADQEEDDAMVRSLENARRIQHLELYVDGGRGDLMRGWAPPASLRRFQSRGPTSALPTLPGWVAGHPWLTSLDVWVRQVRLEEDMRVLAALPSLHGVRLRARGAIEEREAVQTPLTLSLCSPAAFPCLKECAFLHFVTAPSMFPRGAMPRVRRLEFSFRAWDVAGAGGLGLEDLRVEHLPSLEEVHVELWHREQEDGRKKQVEEALRRAVRDHRNRPTIRIKRRI